MRNSLLILLLIAVPAFSQPVEPPVKPLKAKMLPATPKSGELVVIDASSATGNVRFECDFTGGSFAVDGKKLYASVPPAQKENRVYSVRITYWKEEAVEKIDIKVPGTDAPEPEDASTPIGKLTAQVNLLSKQVLALTDAVTAQSKAIYTLDARVKALEGAKPPPPVDAFQKAVQDAYVADGKPADKMKALAAVYKLSGTIVNDPRFTYHKEVLDVMHQAVQTALGEPDPSKVTVLPNVRRVLAMEFNAAIGGKTGALLDANARALIAAEFTKAHKVLEGVQ